MNEELWVEIVNESCWSLIINLKNKNKNTIKIRKWTNKRIWTLEEWKQWILNFQITNEKQIFKNKLKVTVIFILGRHSKWIWIKRCFNLQCKFHNGIINVIKINLVIILIIFIIAVIISRLITISWLVMLSSPVFECYFKPGFTNHEP